MKRFTGHKGLWGTFVDVKVNIPEVLDKQMKSKKYKRKLIFIGTVTDAYQPIEKKYKLTRKILQILLKYQNPVEILTKSNLVLRDTDLLKQFKDITISFTIPTLDAKWKKLTEPYSSSVRERLEAAKELRRAGVEVHAQLGPLWPFFSDIDAIFNEFKKAGISYVFSESFNTIGGNWTGVEAVLKKNYPELLPKMKEIMFNSKHFNTFYKDAEQQIRKAVKKYKIPCTILFGMGHQRTPKEIKA